MRSLFLSSLYFDSSSSSSRYNLFTWHSPRAWFVKFSSLLTTFGFVSCIRAALSSLSSYVDNILVTENDEVDISTTKTYLYSIEKTHLSVTQLPFLYYSLL
ncbi:unnamed protein product [Spirodela intermedia]|uniref:Uncharacterized protein n=1 Tax=Spirodela intermedia TaxID=51605 RepID=A0A7I8JIE9_SPIIN|nr:unnamed protein product [Spirodela intermedia]CAA6669929.1 unnamed protein product [Spirodela intermedia]